MGTWLIADCQRELRAPHMQNKLLSKLNAPVVFLLNVLINFRQADNAVCACNTLAGELTEINNTLRK